MRHVLWRADVSAKLWTEMAKHADSVAVVITAAINPAVVDDTLHILNFAVGFPDVVAARPSEKARTPVAVLATATAATAEAGEGTSTGPAAEPPLQVNRAWKRFVAERLAALAPERPVGVDRSIQHLMDDRAMSDESDTDSPAWSEVPGHEEDEAISGGNTSLSGRSDAGDGVRGDGYAHEMYITPTHTQGRSIQCPWDVSDSPDEDWLVSQPVFPTAGRVVRWGMDNDPANPFVPLSASSTRSVVKGASGAGECTGAESPKTETAGPPVTEAPVSTSEPNSPNHTHDSSVRAAYAHLASLPADQQRRLGVAVGQRPRSGYARARCVWTGSSGRRSCSWRGCRGAG